jgi:DNA adenine methylase
MVYMGSKNRISKELVPIITKDLKSSQWYVEPFVGGCNMMDKIDHPYRLGADSNKYLIALLQAVQNGQKLPEYITKEEYQVVKSNKDNYPDWYIGYVGFICSFRGKYFGGFAGEYTELKTGKQRNYQKQMSNNILKQYANIKNVVLHNVEYNDLIIPENSVIYCDPPYANTTKYSDKFDSNDFWQWCRDKINEKHKMYVSEYNAPDDFVCIWSKDINSNLGGTSKKATEKLFMHKSQLN